MLVGAYPFERPEDKHDNKKLQKMIQVSRICFGDAPAMTAAILQCTVAGQVSALTSFDFAMSLFEAGAQRGVACVRRLLTV